MRSLSCVVVCCLWGSASATVAAHSTVTVGSKIINTVEPEFLSFTCDIHVPSQKCAWDQKLCWAPNASFLLADTTHPRLVNAAKHLSPAILRVGGSPGDRMTYEFGNTKCKKGEFYCLRKQKWDGWQELAQKAGIRIMYGLSFLSRKENGKKWDSTNAKELIEYTYSKFGGKPPMFGFELGNELSTRSNTGNSYSPEDVVTAFSELRSTIKSLSLDHRPKLAGPACGNGGPHNPGWIAEFLSKGGAELLDVVTYHYYGVKSTDKNLPAEVVTTKYMDAEVSHAQKSREEFNSLAPGVPLWLGEGALSALSGQDGLTDRFEDTLWYIVRLGALAANGHSVYNRQTLIGGYYSMFDHHTLRPHPDWWAAVLHKRLMGTKVLSASTSDSGVYTFVHCSKGDAPSGAVTAALVNIGDSERSISFSGIGSSSSQDEYCLTSDKLNSNSVQLNGGANLEMADDGSIPELLPRRSSGDLVLPGHSACFVTLRNAAHAACSSGPSPPPSPSPAPPPPPPAPSPHPSSKGTLNAGETLRSGGKLESLHGNAHLVVQDTDCNLVLRNKEGKSLWSAKISGHAGDRCGLTLNTAGNLFLYEEIHGGRSGPIWSSGEHSGATKAVVTDECRVELQNSAGATLWSVGNSCAGSSDTEILV